MLYNTENNYRSALSYGPVKDNNCSSLPYTIDEAGDLIVTLCYPYAKKVSINLDHEDKQYFTKTDSFFQINLGKVKGFHHVYIQVDGNPVLDPYLPIGFCYSRPVNFIDIIDDSSLFAVHDVPHGSIETLVVKNSVTKKNERVLVYIPSSYSGNHSFDILFLQHGIGENETSWLNQGHVDAILDNMIESKTIRPLLVVMANGMNSVFSSKDEIQCRNFSTYLLNDILPFIKEKYRINNCYMAGLSMGSIETAITTLENPGIFHGVGLFSGFVQDFLGNYSSHIAKENLLKWTQNSFVFRSIGDKDKYISHFFEDDKLLESEHVAHERRIYQGIHDWNVWRITLVDFLKYMETER